MQSRVLIFMLSTLYLIPSSSSALDVSIPSNKGSHAMQAGARHSQGAGIGYTHGYTTLEGFFSTGHCYTEWTPFLDLRGHMFNNGKYAANAGIGLRYLDRSVSWGINSYYDYRNTHEFHYNQWGLGLEAIGSFWSLNVNGYLPVGKKRSGLFGSSLTGTSSLPSFGFFQGNQFFITLSGSQAVVASREFAFKGLDAKFLMHLAEKSVLSVDAGIGPYYFHGSYSKYAIGVEGAVIARIGDYVTLAATGSYDNLFHQRGQLSFGFSIPFGPKNFGKSCSSKQPDSTPSFFNARVTRGARRSEIIVLDKHELVLASATEGISEVAIDPITGQPYVIWFVDNLSSSDGTFESPYPTIQEALAVAQPNDIIYVYPGDGSAYDVDIALQDRQLLLGSGIAQTVETTLGPIVIPAQSGGAPLLENSMGATMITVANENTVSGFTLEVLMAGNTVVANTIDSLVFANNVFSTSVTTGMNNLALSDCTGTLLVQNNQFTMDTGDTGSLAILLTDASGAASALTVSGNTFANHASTPVSLSYSAGSSPTLTVSQNSFTPPAATMGLRAISLLTSGGASLAGSISDSNSFLGYTGNTIDLNWGGSGSHALTIAGNTLASDPAVTGTNGILLYTNVSGSSSLTVSNNTFSGQTSNGMSCTADASATLTLAISGNTLTGTDEPGNNGIQISALNMAVISGTIASNTCSEHLGIDIAGFLSNSSSISSLTISQNILTGPSVVPMGSFPNGIQFNANNLSSASLNIQSNQLTNHASQGINLFAADSAAIASTINNNTVTVPDSLLNTTGIQVSANNSSAVTSTHTITNNVCTGHTNANIQSFPDGDSLLTILVSGNTLTGPSTIPMGATPGGIQVGINGSAQVNATIEQNNCANHINRGVNLFSSNTAKIEAVIDGNTISSPVSTSQTSAITVGGNNTASSPTSSYTITNNVCTNHNNGSIQCFISDHLSLDLLEISDNTIAAVANGISGSGPVGIQAGVNNDCAITTVTITGNEWTSPNTYDPTGTPNGVNISVSNDASFGTLTVSGNILHFPLASYQENTSPTGIQTSLNNNGVVSSLSVSSNTVDFSTSTYVNNSGPSGISVSAQSNSVLTNTAISSNTVAFAALPAILTGLQQGGIGLSGDTTALIGTSISPAVISNNTITGVEGNGIILLNASSNDLYMNVTGNTISLGTVQKNEIGIVTVPFSMSKLVTVIDGNTIEGNNGGFIGIAATNQGPGCQTATVSNNTVTNVHGNNPDIPVPGLGGGIGTALLGSGNLNLIATNNGVSGNTPQGIFGLESSVLGGSGSLCLKLEDNHGAGALPPDDYVLYNYNPMPDPSKFVYEDAGGNTGMILFVPGMGDFTPGTCVSCP